MAVGGSSPNPVFTRSSLFAGGEDIFARRPSTYRPAHDQKQGLLTSTRDIVNCADAMSGIHYRPKHPGRKIP